MTAARSWRLLSRIGPGALADLPWTLPLVEWAEDRQVELARGTHRHVVVFVQHDEGVLALKELPRRLAEREHRILGQMRDEGLPAVDGLGIVLREGLDDVLITRFLEFSLPYRHLFLHRWGTLAETSNLTGRLLDALALLLVRLHLAGFYWGDCSLNNTLLKRDAGALAAYVVDVETGERYPELTDGQRATDLDIAETNVVGGLLDVAAELGLHLGDDPVELATALRGRYEALWDELTDEDLVGPDERYKIDARLARLNTLGFHVDAVELEPTEGGSSVLKMRTIVTEQGHHRSKLARLTGLEVQEQQAAVLLHDLASHRAWLESQRGEPVPQSVAAYRWLSTVFEPTVAAVPLEYRAKLEPAELVVEVLRHKWFLSERRGGDVGVDEAVASYIAEILPSAPDEQLVLADEEPSGYMGFG